jgi:hypothetical protein
MHPFTVVKIQKVTAVIDPPLRRFTRVDDTCLGIEDTGCVSKRGETRSAWSANVEGRYIRVVAGFA